MRLKKILGLSAIVCLVAACVQPRYAMHTAYTLRGCKAPLSRDLAVKALVRGGYVHGAEPKGPFDVFHRPDIVKKGPLAQEPYEDRAGSFAVAVCAAHDDGFLVAEEWTSCKDQKDCTAPEQHELRNIAESWGCEVSERSAHSESWKLEERQDWTNDSCASIVSQLTY